MKKKLTEIEKYLGDNDFKQIIGYDDYLVNTNGEVVKCVINKSGVNIKSVSRSKSNNGILKVNLKNINQKSTTCPVHRLVYNTFVREIQKNEPIYFIDDNINNVCLSNLVTAKELLECYRKTMKVDKE